MTRPDIVQALSKIASFQSNPGPRHWNAAINLLRYLKGTKQLALQYKSTGKTIDDPWNVSLYADADWATDVDDRRSRSGTMVFVNANLVCYRSKKQKSVTTSTCEAEYLSLSDGIKELLWVRHILEAIGIKVRKPMQVYEDNKAVKHILDNPAGDRRTRHIAMRYHHVLDVKTKGLININHICTKKQLTDILTKNLARPTLERLRNQFLK